MPARTPAKELIALAALLVVLAAVVGWQVRNTGATGVSGSLAQVRPESARVAAARDRAAAVPELRLADLKALAAMQAPRLSRNPFREQPPPPPVLPGRSGPGGLAAFIGPQQPPPPPPPPPITLKLVAIVRGSGRPIVGLATATDGTSSTAARETSSRGATGSSRSTSRASIFPTWTDAGSGASA